MPLDEFNLVWILFLHSLMKVNILKMDFATTDSLKNPQAFHMISLGQAWFSMCQVYLSHARTLRQHGCTLGCQLFHTENTTHISCCNIQNPKVCKCYFVGIQITVLLFMS